jgi:Domain of unknown function (DUF1841)
MWLGQERQQTRAVLQKSWRKYVAGKPLEPLEGMIVDIVLRHPELHPVLTDDAQTERDYRPELGESNPFLHLGLHLAVQEQITTDRPSGIRDLHRKLLERWGDPHDAEHRMMECLMETLWAGTRGGTGPDEARYLECVRRATGRR